MFIQSSMRLTENLRYSFVFSFAIIYGRTEQRYVWDKCQNCQKLKSKDNFFLFFRQQNDKNLYGCNKVSKEACDNVCHCYKRGGGEGSSNKCLECVNNGCVARVHLLWRCCAHLVPFSGTFCALFKYILRTFWTLQVHLWKVPADYLHS